MRILCIGDSNTWGYIPGSGLRHRQRWTKVLASEMPDSEIIEEGMNGRTLLSVDPLIKERCGITGLKMLLLSHKPLDCVVVMLGTNELKNFFVAEAEYIAKGVEEFIKIIKDPTLWEPFPVPRILIVSPVPVREEVAECGNMFVNFDANSVEQSKLMGKAIEKVCDAYQADFCDAADFAEASLVDCIHMDKENHKKLAQGLVQKLEEMFGNE